jgi:hypothetical protein
MRCRDRLPRLWTTLDRTARTLLSYDVVVAEYLLAAGALYGGVLLLTGSGSQPWTTTKHRPQIDHRTDA